MKHIISEEDTICHENTIPVESSSSMPNLKFGQTSQDIK